MTKLFYPFCGVVGQERVKKALIYTAIENRLGGVLLCGEKGTAKSTIARALAQVSEMDIVNLPLNVTEDMLIGSIDFESAISKGNREFCGGVLKRAHKNVLYVDEVNLLPDSIVNSLIDVATSGVNRVEREGIKYSHPCETVLVGSMNPEEGKLRPQLLERFGLYVEVSGEEELSNRKEIICRRLKYEQNPEAFIKQYENENKILTGKIAKAKEIVKLIKPEEAVIKIATEMAELSKSQGNRCELLLVRTAAAVAAFEGREYITVSDLKEAGEYVLPHRRRDEKEQTASPQKDNKASDDKQNEEQQKNSTNEGDKPSGNNFDNGGNESNDNLDGDYEESEIKWDMPAEEQCIQAEKIYEIISLPSDRMDRVLRKGTGRRKKTKTDSNLGRYASWSESAKLGRGIALDATLRAAAPYQKWRSHESCVFAIIDKDIRYKKRETHIGATIVFVVDASGSMGVKKRMKETKEAILSMLMDSYQKRDKIGLVTFRRNSAEVLLEITSSAQMANNELQMIATGGRTPLAAGLYTAWQLIKGNKLKDPDMLPMIVLVTDGRANSPFFGQDSVDDAIKIASIIANEKINSIVIDTEKEFITLGIAQKISNAMNAAYFKVNEIKAENIKQCVITQNPIK